MDFPGRPVLVVFVWFFVIVLLFSLKGNRGGVDVGNREGAGRD